MFWPPVDFTRLHAWGCLLNPPRFCSTKDSWIQANSVTPVTPEPKISDRVSLWKPVLKPGFYEWDQTVLQISILFFVLFFIFSNIFESLKSKSTQMLRHQKGNSVSFYCNLLYFGLRWHPRPTCSPTLLNKGFWASKGQDNLWSTSTRAICWQVYTFFG